MPDFEPQGGCSKHGPYSVCGHTTATCLDTKIESAATSTKNKTETEHAVDPKSLLLTAEEEAKVKWGETFPISEKSGDQEISVIGTRHTNELRNVQSTSDALEQFDPDLVFVEGMADTIAKDILDDKVPEIANLPNEQRGEAILSRYQEQVYIAWKAREAGKDVRSWDLQPGEQLLAGLRDAVKPEQKKNQLEYYLNMGALKLLEMGQKPNADAIIKLISDNFGVSVDQLAEFGLSTESLRAVSAKPIDQISKSEAGEKTAPSGAGETNSVLRDLNAVRDRHAMDVIQDAKQKGYKKIFITAGGSHAVTWERAIKKMYH